MAVAAAALKAGMLAPPTPFRDVAPLLATDATLAGLAVAVADVAVAPEAAGPRAAIASASRSPAELAASNTAVNCSCAIKYKYIDYA